jgi:hypothetical protein
MNLMKEQQLIATTGLMKRLPDRLRMFVAKDPI